MGGSVANLLTRPGMRDFPCPTPAGESCGVNVQMRGYLRLGVKLW